jgi:hypothetical protein
LVSSSTEPDYRSAVALLLRGLVRTKATEDGTI